MWDPEKYLDYADLRARPFYDLVSRIGASAPRRVADLGCGPGNLTVDLGKRWRYLCAPVCKCRIQGRLYPRALLLQPLAEQRQLQRMF